MRRGSTVALVTPMHESTGDVDYVSLRKLLRLHVESGTHNLCVLGTTGEASVLSSQERERVLRTAVELVKGKMTILAGTGTIDPKSTKAMTQQAIDVGCDAALVVTPYYVKPPQRGLIQNTVAAADLGLPVVVYNVPGRTGVDFKDENIAVCAQHPNVVGVKDATGDVSRVANLRRLLSEQRGGGGGDDDFLLYSGDDSTSLRFVELGGDGCISVTANVAPRDMSIMMNKALSQSQGTGDGGGNESASSIDERLAGLHRDLFLESNPMPAKWALYRLGLIESPYCRPPLTTFDFDTYGADVEAALKQAGLL